MAVLELSLTSKQAQQVSQLLANETAKKIMDLIAEDSKSESQIAKRLKLPLSTVHYNIQKLVQAGLVSSEEYTYSKKGKEVRHYKLASDHVIITTRPLANLSSLLAGIGLSVAVAVTFFITHLQSAANNVAADAEMMLMESAAQEAPKALRAVPEAMPVVQEPAVWPWILVGAGCMLVGMLAWSLLTRKR